ncbi:hypothetical protein B0H11DRAFT_1899775 [Mycena galericulata]|nr:hypothetical protein B0H11DRAFT_1899775 [Mycena galericulata]
MTDRICTPTCHTPPALLHPPLAAHTYPPQNESSAARRKVAWAGLASQVESTRDQTHQRWSESSETKLNGDGVREVGIQSTPGQNEVRGRYFQGTGLPPNIAVLPSPMHSKREEKSSPGFVTLNFNIRKSTHMVVRQAAIGDPVSRRTRAGMLAPMGRVEKLMILLNSPRKQQIASHQTQTSSRMRPDRTRRESQEKKREDPRTRKAHTGRNFRKVSLLTVAGGGFEAPAVKKETRMREEGTPGDEENGLHSFQRTARTGKTWSTIATTCDGDGLEMVDEVKRVHPINFSNVTDFYPRRDCVNEAKWKSVVRSPLDEKDSNPHPKTEAAGSQLPASTSVAASGNSTKPPVAEACVDKLWPILLLTCFIHTVGPAPAWDRQISQYLRLGPNLVGIFFASWAETFFKL